MDKSAYTSRNVGDFPETLDFAGRTYEKVEDLRYGTNPHQPAAFYRPAGLKTPIGHMEILKSGKNGLSQTNLEDISYSINIVKFFDSPACAVMKHVNPSGAAVTRSGDSLKDVYVKARDCDPRAAFGSVVTFNVELDAETADAIMSTFVECVVAPGFSDDAMAILNEGEQRKLNKSIRVIKCGDPKSLPRFSGEESDTHNTVKVLADGCLVVAAPLTTKLRSVADLKPAQGDSKKAGSHESEVSATPEQLEDLLAAWWINLNVRSNGVVIVKNGQTLAVGTGEQDRVGAVEQAIMKHKEKFEGPATLENAVMSSDGFFPFPDAVEVAAEAGVKAIVSPAGSLRDAEVVKRANELGVALYHAPERIFSHH